MDILKQFPDFHFEPESKEMFYWRPQERTIYYSPERLKTEQGKFLLLHEIGHALLHHEKPADDELYRVERDAWDVARTLADKIGVERDEKFITMALRQMRSLGY